MRIAILQINTIVGDIAGNSAKIAAAARQAGAAGARLAVTPELALAGYMPRDLLLDESFIRRELEAAAGLAQELADGPAVLVGLAEPNPAPLGRPLFNAAALLTGGRIGPSFHKVLAPTHDVFNEDRYFERGSEVGILDWEGRRIGVSIGEKVLCDRDFVERSGGQGDPVEQLASSGADCLLNLSAWPFTAGQGRGREERLGELARRAGRPILLANQVGGADEIIFDGRSQAFDAQGRLIARGKSFEEDLVIVDLDPPGGEVAADDFVPESEIWRALVLGVRDYTAKCGFSRVLLGLSGGIDSCLTATVAVEAVGPANVLGVLMPSPYSSEGSVADSLTLAANLGFKTLTLPIDEVMSAYNQVLAQPFAGLDQDLTEENIQARIRGALLMALSNKTGGLVLATGNKSELGVGYCTLYGDMTGGLAVIADVPKTMVYRLARWLNEKRGREVIPSPVLTKAPSAELRPGQTDQDSLPSYEVIDEILQGYVEGHQSAEEIIAQGLEPKTVRRVLNLIKTAEFKRYQAPPALKVTDRTLGTGWRMPIARR